MTSPSRNESRTVAGLPKSALAYLIGALSVVSMLYVFVLQSLDGRPDGSLVVIVSTYAAMGALIASHRPANPIGWLLLFSAAFGAVISGSSEYLSRENLAVGTTIGTPALLRSLSQWGWVPLVVPVVAFVPMFFPDGRLLSARWRAMPILALVGATAVALAIAVSPWTDESSPSAGPNPYAIDAPWVGPLLIIGFALLLSAIVLAVASLVVRMRSGTRIERQQLKVFFYAAVPWPAAVVTGPLAGVAPWLGPVQQLLGQIGMLAVPVAVAIAIFRYRLYDIDVLIRRTLIYATLSAVLLVAYASAVALVQFALSPVTSGNGLAVAISTLAVVALFQPLRRRTQAAVDQRFYRRRYDAARTLDGFAVRLRDEIDLDALRDELLGAVGETLQPAHASLWLRDRALTLEP